MSECFTRTIRINRPARDVFAWHENAAALPRLTPPWEKVMVAHQSGGIRDGAKVVLKSKIGPTWLTWEMEHFGYEEGSLFCDRQLSGPFKSWTHYHRFDAIDGNACELTDEIHFELPLGVLGKLGSAFTRGKLARLFAYRHAITKSDLESDHGEWSGRVVISGASGVIGQALVPFLRMRGWAVDRLVRRKAQRDDEIEWDPTAGIVKWPIGYAPDAVIHLAGANVAGGRWTAARKQEILASRVDGTRTLARALQQLEKVPKVWLSGSATGFYGERGDERLDESADSGPGFLAEVCRAWERETEVASEIGVRVVHLRTGVVLTPAGGALAKMLPAFLSGAGGPLGDGMQWMSWIGIEDWIRAAGHLLNCPDISGAVNLVSPQAVRNGIFTRELAKVLRRPAIFPIPRTVLKLLFGQMADEALLASTRVKPNVLENSGFNFLHPELENTLRQVLGISR